MFVDLNENNFILFATKHYVSPHMVTSEFVDDLNRLKYLKRIFRKYRQSGELKERLVLNHLIVLSNVFGVKPSVDMLFFKIDKEDYPVLKTFLIFLSFLPENFDKTFNGSNINQREIPVDMVLAAKLRNI